MNRLTEHFLKHSLGVFTKAEIATAIEGTEYSRNGLIKRAIASGDIINIRRGLYCLCPELQKSPISVYSLAQRIYGPSYISMESALSYHGLIPEAVYTITCASFNNSKEFNTPLGLFSYNRIPQDIFYVGVERIKDENNNIFFMASPIKALAEYLYVHMLSWKDLVEPIESLRIDEERFNEINRKEIRVIMDNYHNGRVKRFLEAWVKEVTL
ncbi:MAG: hypothetical protein EOM67_01360 [Spirochaetia bacterium]|nr:hypothetical protein [Spirochaetia bacterium]